MEDIVWSGDGLGPFGLDPGQGVSPGVVPLSAATNGTPVSGAGVGPAEASVSLTNDVGVQVGADAITFFLADATTDEIIRPLAFGDVIDPTEFTDRLFTIIAEVDDAVDAESVVFRLNGQRVRTESIEPYALFGDNPFTGNLFGRNVFDDGVYELEASAFSRNFGRGVEVAEALIAFTIGPDLDNNPPIALDDAYAVSEDVARVINAPGVLENDNDPDGDAIRVVEVDGAALAVGQQVTLASGAFLKLNSDGSFTYDPNGQFDDLDDGESAEDHFAYTISDGRGGRSTATATITITGVTDPPVPDPISFFLVDADADQIIRPLSSGDTIDPDELDGARFSIIAKLGDGVDAESVVFELNGDRIRTENIEPYALFGDNARSGNIFGRSLFEPGEYELEATAFSRNRGRGAEVAEATLAFKIGTPELSVAVTGITDDTGTPGDGVTSDDTLVINGTATPGSLVEILIDGSPIGNTTADGAGTWSFDHSDTPLGEGVFAITAAVEDAGGSRTESDPIAAVIDQTPPAAPAFDLAAGSDSGAAGDKITNVNPVTLEGTTDPNTLVEIEALGLSTISDGAGAFSFGTVILAEGDNDVTLKASDAAGNSSTATMSVTLDTAAPAAPAFDLAAGSDSGAAGDKTTNVSPVTLEGTTDPNTLVEIEALGLSTTSDGAGAFVFAAVALSEGDNDFTLKATDEAGNSSTATMTVTLDTAAPAVPAFDLAPGSDSGTPGDKITDVNPVTLEGTTDPDTLVEIQALGLSTTSDGSGDFSFADVVLAEGGNEFVVTATDEAGNSSTSTMTITLETTPQVVAVTGIADDTGTPGDGVTSDDTLVINGTATPDQEVEVFIDGVSIGTTLADGSGDWSFDHSGTALGEGLFVITAALSASVVSDPFNATVDRTAPAVSVTAIQDDTGADDGDGVTSDNTLVIEGTASEAGTVEVFVDGVSVGTTTSDGSGAWSFDNTAAPVSEGDHAITATITDLAGNTATSEAKDIFVDSLPPAAPVVTLDGASDSGLLGDLVTNITPVTLNGSTDPNTPVRLEPLGLETTSDGGGAFAFADVALVEGANLFTVIATDDLGNEASSDVTVTLDTIAPIFNITAPLNGGDLDGDSRLQGTVDGTGSLLTSLSYEFNPLAPGSTPMPVAFDPTTGAVDVPLDLSGLSVGDGQEFDLLATDAAGNLGVQVFFLDLPDLPTLGLTDNSPADGAGEIGLTFRPEIQFSRAVDPATLTDQSFFATDPAGDPIPATIVPRLDGRGAFLFFDDPLPGASEITVHVDGDLIQGAADGAALDGDDDGFPGGEFTYAFTTVNQVAVAGTTLVGRIVDPGPDLAPGTADDRLPGADGELGTDDDVFLLPIEGAKVFILGREGEFVLTDANGDFELDNVPSGNVKVAVDGRTATNAPAGVFFPEMVMDMTVLPGVENTIPGGSGTPEQQGENQGVEEVYLPRLNESILVPVSDSDPTLIISNADSAPNLTPEERANLNLLIQPGSIIGEDGQPVVNPTAGISTVPPELVRDMLPQGILQHTFDITIQVPDGAVFAQPATLTFPNVFDAPPGTKLNFLSFNHTTGRLEIEGTATVSEDGLSVTTDPDTGITQPGWHGLTPAGSDGMGPDEPDDPKDNNPSSDDWQATLADAVKKYSKAFKDFSSLSKVINAVDTLREKFPSLGQNIGDAIGALGASDSIGAMEKILSAATDTKAIVKSAFEIANAGAKSGSINRVSLAIDLGLKTVEIALGDLSRQRDPDCPNPGLEEAIERLEFMKLNIGAIKNTFDAIKNFVDGKIRDGVIKSLCTVADAAIFELKKQIDDARANNAPSAVGLVATAEGPPGAALANVNFEDRPITDILTPEELAQFIADFNAVQDENDLLIAEFPDAEILPLVQGVAEADVAIGGLADALGGLYVAANGNPPNAPFLITGQDGFEIRGTTEANGEVDVFLPAETELTLQIYDARTNSIGETTFTTERSGIPTQIPIPFYFNVDDLPDADGDLLVDDAEAIVGTDPNAFDTDGDGVSDFVEVKDGTNPLNGIPVATGIVAALPLSGEAMELVIEGTNSISESETAFVATGSFGLAVVDVSDALTPLLLAELDLPGTASDVAVDPRLGIAVVAAGAAGFHTVDVSDPSNPGLLFTTPVSANQVELFGGRVYVDDGPNLRSFDLVSGAEEQALPLGGNIVGLARDGNFLYTSDDSSAFRVIEIVEGNMVARGTQPLADNGRPFVGGGIAYLPFVNAGGDGGYFTIDVSDPDNPALVGTPGLDAVANRDIALNGSGLGVIVGSLGTVGTDMAFDVVDTSDPTNTSDLLTRFVLPAMPEAVAIGAGIAFVANGTAGLQVVNYSALDDQGVAPTLTVTEDLDIDPVADGIQVLEGRTVTLNATVQDDVQIRNIELLVDGLVVRNDVSFPFELFADLPSIADNDDETMVTLQVRATDTGGNVSVSDLIEIELVEDLTAPTLLSQSVNQDDEIGSSIRTFNFTFDEPLDEFTVSDQSFKLIGPGAVEVHPIAIQLLEGGRVVRLSYDPLAQGLHTFMIDEAVITDRAGNALGSDVVTTDFTVTDFTNSYIGPDGGSWFDPANWSAGTVPDAGDDVLVSLPGAGTVTFLGGVDEVVVSRLVLGEGETLEIQAGMLRVTNDAELGGVTLTAGQLALDGTSSIVDLDMDGGSLDGAGTVTISNSLDWDGNGQMTGLGTTVLAQGATANLGAGGSDLDLGRTLEIAGQAQLFSFLAFGTFDAVNGNETGILSILATGRLEIVDDDNLNEAGTLLNLGAPPHQILNAGTLVKSGAGTASLFSVPLTDTGTIEVQGGTLEIGGGGSSSGAITVAAGTELLFSDRDFTFEAGSSVTGAGTLAVRSTEVTVNSAAALIGLGLVDARDDGGFEINVDVSIANLKLDSSNSLVGVTGSGEVTVTGNLDWISGVMEGTGKTILAAGATAVLGDSGTPGQEILTLVRAFDVAGSAQLESALMIFGNTDNAPVTLTVLSSGSFEMIGEADLGVGNIAGTKTIVNDGTFTKSGAGESLIPAGFGFTNNDTVNVDVGLLRILGLFVNNGTVNETNGGQLLEI